MNNQTIGNLMLLYAIGLRKLSVAGGRCCWGLPFNSIRPQFLLDEMGGGDSVTREKFLPMWQVSLIICEGDRELYRSMNGKSELPGFSFSLPPSPLPPHVCICVCMCITLQVS